MRTEQLIKALAADSGAPRIDLGQRLAIAAAIGFAFSALAFVLVLGPRPDIAAALTHDARFALKFIVTLALALTAAGLALRLSRPGAPLGWWRAAVLLGPALLAAGVLYELLVVDPSLWRTRAIGRNAMVCLVAVPALAAPILIALLFAMKAGAPMRPALAGALAGLAAAGLAAALYAAHCADDSPLFVAVWYSVAIALVTAVGSLAGARWLKW